MRQFGALVKRLQMRDEKKYIAAGIVAATVANCAPFADPKREPANPLDFVPGLSAEQRKRNPQVMSVEEQIKALVGMFGCGPTQEQVNAAIEKEKATEVTESASS